MLNFLVAESDKAGLKRNDRPEVFETIFECAGDDGFKYFVSAASDYDAPGYALISTIIIVLPHVEKVDLSLPVVASLSEKLRVKPEQMGLDMVVFAGKNGERMTVTSRSIGLPVDQGLLAVIFGNSEYLNVYAKKVVTQRVAAVKKQNDQKEDSARKNVPKL